jgi:hypothetical protein
MRRIFSDAIVYQFIGNQEGNHDADQRVGDKRFLYRLCFNGFDGEFTPGYRSIEDSQCRIHGMRNRRERDIKRQSASLRQRDVECDLQRQGLSVFTGLVRRACVIV